MLTIVTYHYVRDLGRSRYPAIKGLTTQRFEGQLDYLTRHYTVCSFGQVIAALRGGEALPRNACLLTFDDGLLDHYVTVFPRLVERGIVGSFYPSAAPVEEHRVMDVHKIHFILAAAPEPSQLAGEILALLRQHGTVDDLPSDEELYRRYGVPGRYDPPEVVFVKRMLQRALPEPVRSRIVDILFARYVSEDEPAFSSELYMDLAQMRCMVRYGMEIGGHGARHVWLETLPRSEQAEEIDRTVQFLTNVYERPPADWVMCYPHGSFNSETLELLAQSNCTFGLTVVPGLESDLSRPLQLRRLDTNDLPCSGDAELSSWTRMED
jgi:peptidoglycan/xylan/chitin deacetylase (PgdA/CDA1 family)